MGCRLRAVAPCAATSRTIRFLPILALATLTSGYTPRANAAAAGRGPPWRVSRADSRIRVSPAVERPHLLRVDLPQSCRDGVGGVCAYLPDGQMIPASPILQQADVVAVEILVPKLESDNLPTEGGGPDAPMHIEVYLLPDTDDVPLPCAPATRLPVSLERTVRPLTTRPFTPGEMRNLVAIAAPRAAETEVAAFGPTVPESDWNAPPEKNAAILHWATEILLQQESEVRLGTDQAHVAWFLYLDCELLADWRGAAKQGEDAWLSAWQRLRAGLHRLDLFAVQRVGEPIPTVLHQPSSGQPASLPASLLLPVRRPASLLLESRDGVLQAGLRVDGIRRYTAADTDTEILCFEATPISTHFFGRRLVSYSIRCNQDEDADPSPPWSLAVPGVYLPALELALSDELGYAARLVRPGHLVFPAPVILRFRLRIGGVPAVLSHDALLPIDVRLELPPKTPTRLLGDLDLTWRQLDEAGAVLASRATEVRKAGAPFSMQILLSSGVETVELAASFARTPLTVPSRIRVVHPDASLAGLRGHGRGLSRNGSPAVLACMPLAALAAPADAKAEAVTDTDRRLTIVDDFWAVANGPDADVLPEKMLSRGGSLAVRRISVPSLHQASARELRKFSVLAEALDGDSRQIVWAVGVNELRAGLCAEEICLHLLFLAQATRAAGAMPVLMTIPSVPGVSAKELRRTALLTKELACRLGVPVVDAYSRAKEARDHIGEFAGFFSSYDGSVSLATPNNTGRVWLTRLLQDSLAREDATPVVRGAME